MIRMIMADKDMCDFIDACINETVTRILKSLNLPPIFTILNQPLLARRNQRAHRLPTDF